LRNQNGILWNSFEELITLVGNVEDLLKTTHPRKWVLQTMTDEIAVKHMLRTIQCSWEEWQETGFTMKRTIM